jgi:hypothetical protein
MLIAIFENEWVICELDDTLPVLRHRWKTAPPGEEFKRNLLRILDEFKVLKKSYPRLAWLADTTLLGELEEDIEQWLVKVWEGLLFGKEEVKIHAVILGASILADYPMEKFKLDAEQKFKAFDVRLGVFSNAREAYDWIGEQQASLLP